MFLDLLSSAVPYVAGAVSAYALSFYWRSVLQRRTFEHWLRNGQDFRSALGFYAMASNSKSALWPEGGLMKVALTTVAYYFMLLILAWVAFLLITTPAVYVYLAVTGKTGTDMVQEILGSSQASNILKDAVLLVAALLLVLYLKREKKGGCRVVFDLEEGDGKRLYVALGQYDQSGLPFDGVEVKPARRFVFEYETRQRVGKAAILATDQAEAEAELVRILQRDQTVKGEVKILSRAEDEECFSTEPRMLNWDASWLGR